MANDPKNAKKVTTKAPKLAGVHKVPKYAQQETASAPQAAKPASKGNK